MLANHFNNFFTNVAENIRKNVPPTSKHFREYLNRPTINTFFFSPVKTEEVIEIVREMDPRKATGPYSIPSKILHLFVHEISEILTKLFNLSFLTGKFITQLKTAKVIPLFKNKGSEQDVSNYRPIALLSNIDKIFEKIVHQRLITFLNKSNSIFERQFGFRQKHATIHNLITLTEEIRENLDENKFFQVKRSIFLF